MRILFKCKIYFSGQKIGSKLCSSKCFWLMPMLLIQGPHFEYKKQTLVSFFKCILILSAHPDSKLLEDIFYHLSQQMYPIKMLSKHLLTYCTCGFQMIKNVYAILIFKSMLNYANRKSLLDNSSHSCLLACMEAGRIWQKTTSSQVRRT